VDSIRGQCVQGFLFKVDFQKAFNSVTWDFILEVMAFMGFSGKWISWTQECISTAKLLVLINGSPSNEFHRQGNPMSPFVFNIAVERLAILFGRAMENGLYSGIQLLAQKTTLLQYADDTLIFYPNDIQVLKNVKTILNLFGLCSGLKVNFHKSTLIGVNVDLEFTKGVVGASRCKYSGLQIKYLGLPLGENPRLCSTRKPVIEKIKSRLKTWKGRMISTSRGICLLKLVLCNLPLCYMFLFKLSSGVAKKIISLRRQFVWSKVRWHGIFYLG